MMVPFDADRQGLLDDIVSGLNSVRRLSDQTFAFAELLARVRALLRRTELEGAEIRFADLRLDPVTHKVWRKTRRSTYAKEYALLEFFMRNPNQVLTRTTIAENVWTMSLTALRTLSMFMSTTCARR
jgi:DNA-binding response OmpR family regulator